MDQEERNVTVEKIWHSDAQQREVKSKLIRNFRNLTAKV
jgi:hypothetical protein